MPMFSITLHYGWLLEPENLGVLGFHVLHTRVWSYQSLLYVFLPLYVRPHKKKMFNVLIVK